MVPVPHIIWFDPPGKAASAAASAPARAAAKGRVGSELSARKAPAAHAAHAKRTESGSLAVFDDHRRSRKKAS